MGNVTSKALVSSRSRTYGDGVAVVELTYPPATTLGALLQCKLNLLSRVLRSWGMSLSIGVARLVTLDIAAARSVGKMILDNMIKVVETVEKA